MKKQIDALTPASQNALLDYLSDEIDAAETKDDLLVVLEIMRELMLPQTHRKAVMGLGHIHAELDMSAFQRPDTRKVKKQTSPSMDSGMESVRIEIPLILADTFQDLSHRLRALHKDDPVTFANATSALTWLARGEIKSVS